MDLYSEIEKMTFVFVHGFQGWGSYDKRYKKMPYWGMRGGDLIAWLNGKGYHAYAASVSPIGSAWDRACELYAQLAGTRVDYGVAHSKEYGHGRYGEDYTGRALIPCFDADTKLVLIGHSFGGATVNLFTELMANGDAGERAAADQDTLSPLFAGGMGERIRSVVALAAGQNGNASYEIPDDYQLEGDDARIPWWSRLLSRRVTNAKRKGADDDRDARDCAEYDMHIDAAHLLNQRISVLPHVLYLSVPCSFTKKNQAGFFEPEKGMEAVFIMRSMQMGRYLGKTKGGVILDESWWENDGRVNTISETAPFGAPQTPLDRNHLRVGMWNVYPSHHGDHMSLQGGLLKKHDIRGFYEEMLEMITREALNKSQCTS